MTGTLAALMSNPRDLGIVVGGFERVIFGSFIVDQGPQTMAEIKRRFEICTRIFKELRGDLDWGLQRILDHLPAYLRAELDGMEWEPDTRQCWVPSDGTMS